MIKVVFVLVVLLLSAIFAYLALSNKKGAKSSNETEPSEEEDPGTCETTGDWAMSGECQADGTAIFTQTYKESKPGACPSTEKARVKPCCYQKGDWKDNTGCNERGRKTQEQTTVNCADAFKQREVDCPYVGSWRKTGECNSSGRQYYVRDVVNSGEPREKTERCGLPMGRYVKLVHVVAYDPNAMGNVDDKNKIINLAELEVFDEQGRNLSARKYVTGSSQYPPPHVWSNLTDGNKGNFAHTYGRTQSEYDSMTVDLGSVKEIKKLVITNRRDCCKHRAIGIKAVILAGDGVTVVKETQPIPHNADTYTLTFPVNYWSS